MAALVMGGSLLAATCAVVITVRASDQGSKAKSIGLVVDNRPLTSEVKISTSFAPIVKKVVPSVVKVEVYVVVELEAVLGVLIVVGGRVVVKGVSGRNGLTFNALHSQNCVCYGSTIVGCGRGPCG